MLYIKGKINLLTRKEPEGKKPYYDVQVTETNSQGSFIPTWCKLYSDQKLKVGDEIEVQVKVNTWDKDKFRLIGFMNS